LKEHAYEIFTKFANADLVHELREHRLAAERDKEADERAQGKSTAEMAYILESRTSAYFSAMFFSVGSSQMRSRPGIQG